MPIETTDKLEILKNLRFGPRNIIFIDIGSIIDLDDLNFLTLEWVDVIKGLMEQKAIVYGLLQSSTGKMGAIASREEIFYRALALVGIYFSETYKGETIIPYFVRANSNNKYDHPVFYKGIFLTGSVKETDIIEEILANNPKITRVTYLGNNQQKVEEINRLCKNKTKNYIGIIFEPKKLKPLHDPSLYKEDEKALDCTKTCLGTVSRSLYWLWNTAHQFVWQTMQVPDEKNVKVDKRYPNRAH